MDSTLWRVPAPKSYSHFSVKTRGNAVTARHIKESTHVENEGQLDSPPVRTTGKNGGRSIRNIPGRKKITRFSVFPLRWKTDGKIFGRPLVMYPFKSRSVSHFATAELFIHPDAPWAAQAVGVQLIVQFRAYIKAGENSQYLTPLLPRRDTGNNLSSYRPSIN
jgi:hypothetical protein